MLCAQQFAFFSRHSFLGILFESSWLKELCVTIYSLLPVLVGEVMTSHLLTRPLLLPVSNGSYVQADPPHPSPLLLRDLRSSQICGQSLHYLMMDSSKTLQRPKQFIHRSKQFYNSRITHCGLLSSCLLTKVHLPCPSLLILS
jgi:hypothetical protein